MQEGSQLVEYGEEGNWRHATRRRLRRTLGKRWALYLFLAALAIVVIIVVVTVVAVIAHKHHGSSTTTTTAAEVGSTSAPPGTIIVETKEIITLSFNVPTEKVQRSGRVKREPAAEVNQTEYNRQFLLAYLKLARDKHGDATFQVEAYKDTADLQHNLTLDEAEDAVKKIFAGIKSNVSPKLASAMEMYGKWAGTQQQKSLTLVSIVPRKEDYMSDQDFNTDSLAAVEKIKSIRNVSKSDQDPVSIVVLTTSGETGVFDGLIENGTVVLDTGSMNPDKLAENTTAVIETALIFGNHTDSQSWERRRLC